MTIENDSLRDDLRALMKAVPIGLPEYSGDPIVQRRVGRLLVAYGSAQPVWAANADLSPNNENELGLCGGSASRAPRR